MRVPIVYWTEETVNKNMYLIGDLTRDIMVFRDEVERVKILDKMQC